MKGAFATAVLSVGLFLAFTPFEWPGTYYSVAIGALAPLFALGLVHMPSIVQSLIKPSAAWAGAIMIFLHMTMIQPVSLPIALGVLATAASAAAIGRYGTHFRTELSGALNLVLLLQVIGLAVQGVTLIATGEAASLHNLLFPMSQDRTGTEHVGVVRLGGFQIEPGTYSVWTAMLLTMLRLWKGRFGVLEIIGMVSILATYSAAGVVFVVVLLTWLLADMLRARNLNRVAIGLVAIAAAVALAAALGTMDYLEERFVNRADQGSIEVRENPYLEWRSLSLTDKLLGIGFGQQPCGEDCASRELGFAFHVLTRGGILTMVGFLLVLGFLLTRSSRAHAIDLIFALLVVAIAKAAPSNVAPWLVLFALSDLNRARRRRARMAWEQERSMMMPPHGGVQG